MRRLLTIFVMIAAVIVITLLTVCHYFIVNGGRYVIANDVCLERNYGYKSCFDGKSYYYISGNDIFRDETLVSTVGTSADRVENIIAFEDEVYVNINNEIYTVESKTGRHSLYMTDAVLICADSNYIFVLKKNSEQYELLKVCRDDKTKTNISAQRSLETNDRAIEVIDDDKYIYVFINDGSYNPNREYARYMSGISMIIDPDGRVLFSDKDSVIWENIVLGICGNFAILSDVTRNQLYLYDMLDSSLVTKWSLSDECTYKTGSVRMVNEDLYLVAEKYEFMKKDVRHHEYDVILKINIEEEQIQEDIIYKTKKHIVGYDMNVVWLFDGKGEIAKYNYIEGKKLEKKKIRHLREQVYFEACNEKIFVWTGDFGEKMQFCGMI